MDGLTVLRKLRARADRGPRVLVLTVKGPHRGSRAGGSTRGADDYLSKALRAFSELESAHPGARTPGAHDRAQRDHDRPR